MRTTAGTPTAPGACRSPWPSSRESLRILTRTGRVGCSCPCFVAAESRPGDVGARGDLSWYSCSSSASVMAAEALQGFDGGPEVIFQDTFYGREDVRSLVVGLAALLAVCQIARWGQVGAASGRRAFERPAPGNNLGHYPVGSGATSQRASLRRARAKRPPSRSRRCHSSRV